MPINKRYVFLLILFFGTTLLNGCNTVKGFSDGLESTIEGVGADTYVAGGMIKNLDDWIKENLW